MSRQERNFPKLKKETQEQFEERLRKTALNLPTSFIDAAIGDMQRRCQRLYKAKGGVFKEGGRKRKRQRLS